MERQKTAHGRATLIQVLLVAGVFIVGGIADANAQRRGGGGGARAGGGGGGRMAQSSVSGASRASGGGNRASAGGGNRAGNGNNGNNGNRAANGSGNRVNNGNNNVGNGNRVNNGDINIDRGDVNVNVDGGYGRVRYPLAAGMAIGAMAVTTAAVMGSYYYALPPGCTTVITNGVSYQRCGSVYYQQTWEGNDAVYVVVEP